MNITIQLFGHFEIKADGFPILLQIQHSRKSMLLLEYLILKNGAATAEEIMEVLWPDENDSSNPETALRTLVHRYRRLAQEAGFPEMAEAVRSGRGYYQWEPKFPCEVDVRQFEELCRKNLDGLSVEEKQKISEEVLRLYRGKLLGDSSEELWGMSKGAYYHSLYREYVLRLMNDLWQKRDYTEIVHVCRRAIDVDPLEEQLHLNLIRALLAAGSDREAMQQYELARNVMSKELDLPPSSEMQEAYRQILRADQGRENNIASLCAALREPNVPTTALVCEYEAFKSIYRLYDRLTIRYEVPICLVVVTLTGIDNQDPRAMRGLLFDLQNILSTHLRVSDVIAQYNARQCLCLLPSVNYSTGQIVMERIKKELRRRHPRTAISISYELTPMLPSK